VGFQSSGAPELGACLQVIRDRLSKRVLQRIDWFALEANDVLDARDMSDEQICAV